MQIFGYLKELEDYFIQEKKNGRKIAEIYEAVQQADSIIQRLYLMITAGSAYAKSKEISSKEIMDDLLEMVKGIQNPIRGLFLRYYMLKKLKEIFPDSKRQDQGYLI